MTYREKIDRLNREERASFRQRIGSDSELILATDRDTGQPYLFLQSGISTVSPEEMQRIVLALFEECNALVREAWRVAGKPSAAIASPDPSKDGGEAASEEIVDPEAAHEVWLDGVFLRMKSNGIHVA